jgi:hypothetical protein
MTAEGPWRWLAANERPCLLLFALLVRLVAFPFVDGQVWPDEVHQSIEPAHALAFDQGILPWEWERGIRSWAVPYLYAVFFEVLDLFSAEAAGELFRCASIASLGFSLLVVDASWRIGRVCGGVAGARVAALLAAVFPPLLYYAPRTLGDSMATWFLFWGFARFVEAQEEGDRPSRHFMAGVIVGIAYLFRYTAPMYMIGPGLLLLARRRWAAAAALLGGFVAIATAIGIVDWPTYGRPFHSVYHYFRFNLYEGGSARFGTQPYEWYLVILVRDLGPAAFFALALAAIGGARTRGLGLGIVLGLTLMSLTAHKEERYLVPILSSVPLFLALGAVRLATPLGRWRVAVAALVVGGLLGSVLVAYARKSWRPEGNWYDAVRYIGRQPDARGMILQHGWQNLGGYVLHHQPIPMLSFPDLVDKPHTPALFDNELLNYVAVTPEGLRRIERIGKRGAYDAVAQFGDVLVLRRREPP